MNLMRKVNFINNSNLTNYKNKEGIYQKLFKGKTI